MTAKVSLLNCFVAGLLTLSCSSIGAADRGLPEQFNEIKQTTKD